MGAAVKKEQSPAFMFYVKDYESDENVKGMSLEQEGAYLRLLLHGWLHGSIPEDVPTIAKICRVPRAKMARLWNGIRPCWKPAGNGRLKNKRQERERRKQKEYRQGKAEAGLKGAQKRWQSHESAKPLPIAKDSFPFPFPSTNNNEPPLPPAGGDVHRDLPPPRTGPAFQSEKNRLEHQVEQARQFCITNGGHPNRGELRAFRAWFKAGHSLADVQAAIERGDHQRRRL